MLETHFQLLRFQFIVLPEETPNLTFSCMSNDFVTDFFVAYSLVICFIPAFSKVEFCKETCDLTLPSDHLFIDLMSSNSRVVDQFINS